MAIAAPQHEVLGPWGPPSATNVKEQQMSDASITAPKAETAARKTDRVVETIKQATETAVNKVAEDVKTVQEQARGGLQKVSELARGYVDVQRETLETVAKAGKIYGEGLQTIAKHAAEVSRVQFEDGVAHLRSLTGVKSITDLFALQAEFARKTASRALSEGSTMVEEYLKVANEAIAPVTARAREAAEKVKQAA
jgi:phasin family protein